MKHSPLLDKSFTFSVNVIKLCEKTHKSWSGKIISHQLFRAATSIGANINEARYAQSRADFISKMHIALKEASETSYWLGLLNEAGLADCAQLVQDVNEIIKMLTATLNTTKKGSERLKRSSE